jgi:hypothetical protein
VRLLVRPETVLHWHRDLVARRRAAKSRLNRSGWPTTVHSIRALVLRLARALRREAIEVSGAAG